MGTTVVLIGVAVVIGIGCYFTNAGFGDRRPPPPKKKREDQDSAVPPPSK